MSLEGVLLIDKPKGPSSFEVVRRVRALTGQKRVGHAGTLDPLASGLMVVAVGRYTKLCSYLTEASKVYETIIELGVTTTTDDQEG
ncbi:MAG TPA: tRNA pseudouridine(55) synthase TruB, partial [Myxococcota bacterium]|nr:tRNA pseudouridine(55) synthase TruB [Myxococcota bacterium]